MQIEYRLQQVILWIAAIVCFLAGAYYAINASFSLLFPHGYLFAPLGDDALDGASLLYPIFMGKKAFLSIFQPYADHRLVIGRLWGIFDYFITNGTQALNPFRAMIALWLGYFLLIVPTICLNKNLSLTDKLLLSGVYFSFVFSGCNMINYGTTLQNTWPFVLVFALLAFIFAERYCATFQDIPHARIKQFALIFLTFIFIQLTLFTFSSGLILWPIIFIILIKRHCIKPHWYIWLALALLSYYSFTYDGWHAEATQRGIRTFFHSNMLSWLLYFSRLVSVPIIPNVDHIATFGSVIWAICLVVMSLFSMVLFLKKKDWGIADTIIFACLLFGFSMVIAISISRFWMTFEAIGIGWRFLIANFILMISILLTGFTFIKELGNHFILVKSIAYIVVMAWLLAIFIPGDFSLTGGPVGVSSAGWNQYLILEATGVPIDAGFVEEIKQVQNQQDVKALNFLHDVQKNHQKGVYSLWPSQYVNQLLRQLNLKEENCGVKAVIHPSIDFRKHHNPGLFLEVQTNQYRNLLTDKWDVLFTNKAGIIIGFGMSSVPNFDMYRLPQYIEFENVDKGMVRFQVMPLYFVNPYLEHTWRSLMLHDHSQMPLLWSGAINTKLLQGDKNVTAWAVNKKESVFCKLGTIKI